MWKGQGYVHTQNQRKLRRRTEKNHQCAQLSLNYVIIIALEALMRITVESVALRSVNKSNMRYERVFETIQDFSFGSWPLI